MNALATTSPVTLRELEPLAAELESFARRLRNIADREASLPALRAAEHIVAAADELGLEIAP